MYLLALITVLLGLVGSGQMQGSAGDCPETHLCVQDYCTNCYNQNKCGEGDPEDYENGTMISTFVNNDDFCDCCPKKFVQYMKEGDSCYTTISNDITQGICGAGLICSESVCIRRTDHNCAKTQKEYDDRLESGDVGMDEVRPECDDDGYWAPVQCSFGGVCRCVDKLTGEPIFGIEENLESARMSEMDCACAREMVELREMGCAMKVPFEGSSGEVEGDISDTLQRYEEEYLECLNSQDVNDDYFPGHLRCLPNGNFDPAQCIEAALEPEQALLYEDVCFCIGSDLKLNGSTTSINTAYIALECHREDDLHVKYYYRNCEKQWKEYESKVLASEIEGQVYLGTEELPICGPDGFYSIIQKDPKNGTKGICTKRDGSPIENGAFTGDNDRMNCYCAQARSILGSAEDKPICKDDGSFREYQCRYQRCYCVNEFGQQTGMDVDYLHLQELPCFSP